MLKVVFGGGGWGMCVVCKEEDFVNVFQEAWWEVGNVFGDDIVFIEKFIDQFKYIEVQLLGDKYGNLVYLFERDCFVQCCFQKVVEIVFCFFINEVIK